MKTTSIITIKEVLEKERDSAYALYENTKRELESKYGSNYVFSEITESELNLVTTCKQNWIKLKEACEEFTDHKWK